MNRLSFCQVNLDPKAKGNCVAQAITIATGLPYQEIRARLFSQSTCERKGKRKRSISHPDKGVYRQTSSAVLKHLGWKWVPTMGIGTGCRVHLNADDLPKNLGPLIVKVTRHLTVVSGGIIFDTFNPDRGGTRCVYGYYYKP